MKEAELQQLEQRVQELVDWKNARIKERLVFPLETQAKKAIIYHPTVSYRELPVFTDRVFPAAYAPLSDLTGLGIEIIVNNKRRIMLGITK